MKSKAAVVALCVCVILAILGVVLGKSPALENTELPPSVSEKILSSQEISSESEASSAEVSTPAKAMTPKEEYESMYGKPQWLVCDQTYHESCAAVNGVQSMKDISTVPVGETAKIVFPVAVSERMLPSSKCGEEAIRAAEYRLILTNYPERQEIVLSS